MSTSNPSETDKTIADDDQPDIRRNSSTCPGDPKPVVAATTVTETTTQKLVSTHRMDGSGDHIPPHEGAIADKPACSSSDSSSVDSITLQKDLARSSSEESAINKPACSNSDSSSIDSFALLQKDLARSPSLIFSPHPATCKPVKQTKALYVPRMIDTTTLQPVSTHTTVMDGSGDNILPNKDVTAVNKPANKSASIDSSPRVVPASIDSSPCIVPASIDSSPRVLPASIDSSPHVVPCLSDSSSPVAQGIEPTVMPYHKTSNDLTEHSPAATTPRNLCSEEPMITQDKDARKDSHNNIDDSDNESNTSQTFVLKYDDEFDMEQLSPGGVSEKMAVKVWTAQEIPTKDTHVDVSEDNPNTPTINKEQSIPIEVTDDSTITDICLLGNVTNKSENTSMSNSDDDVSQTVNIPTIEAMEVVHDHKLNKPDAMIEIPSQLFDHLDFNSSSDSINEVKEDDNDIESEMSQDDSKEVLSKKGHKAVKEDCRSSKQESDTIVKNIDSLVKEIDQDAAGDDTDTDEVLEKLADILETSDSDSPSKSSLKLRIIPTTPIKKCTPMNIKEENIETDSEDKEVVTEMVETNLENYQKEKCNDTSANEKADVKMSAVEECCRNAKYVVETHEDSIEIKQSPEVTIEVAQTSAVCTEDINVQTPENSHEIARSKVSLEVAETTEVSHTEDNKEVTQARKKSLEDTATEKFIEVSKTSEVKIADTVEMPSKVAQTNEVSKDISQSLIKLPGVAKATEKSIIVAETTEEFVHLIQTTEESINVAQTTEVSMYVSQTTDESIDVAQSTIELIDGAQTIDESKDVGQATEVSMDVSQTTDESVDVAHSTNELIDGAQTTEESKDGAKITEESKDAALTAEKSIDFTQKSKESIDVTQTTKESIAVAHTTKESIDVAETTEESEFEAQTTEKSTVVAQTTGKSIDDTQATGESIDGAQTTEYSKEAASISIVPENIAEPSEAPTEVTHTIEESKEVSQTLQNSKDEYQTLEESKTIPQTSEVTKDMSQEDLNDIETFIKQVKPIASTFMDQIAPDKPESDIKKKPKESTFMNLNLGPDKVPEADQMPSVEVPDIDSLGLLAESSRVMDDDDNDDPDTPEEDEDDDDEDPDYDESSNQAGDLSENHSEDHSENHSEESNQMQLESELSSLMPSCSDDTNDYLDKERGMPVGKDNIEGLGHIGVSFAVGNVTRETDAVDSEVEKDGDMELDITEDVVEPDMVVDDNEDPEVPLDTDDETSELIKLLTKSLPDADKQEETQDSSSLKSRSSPKETASSPTPTLSPKETNLLQSMLAKTSDEPDVTSPSKQKLLVVSQPNNIVNIVDLEESSEDVVPTEALEVPTEEGVTNVNIPTGIDIMASGENVSDIKTVKGESVISGVPKPATHKLARLNTDEITIKTGATTDAIVIPETKSGESPSDQNEDEAVQVFSLDSDDDEIPKEPIKKRTTHEIPPGTPKKQKKVSKERCVNPACPGYPNVAFYPASRNVLANFETAKKTGMVCECCLAEVLNRAQSLIDGIKDFTPLLKLNMRTIRPDLVTISDSDDEEDPVVSVGESLGLEVVQKLETELASIINEQWDKYKLDDRMQEAKETLDQEIDKLNDSTKELRCIMNECQAMTDKLREDLYATFEPTKERIAGLIIYDTPDRVFSVLEPLDDVPTIHYETRQSKRRLSSASELPAKKQAVPLAPTTTATEVTETTDVPEPAAPSTSVDTSNTPIDDDKEDVSVVHLSKESAPASLPPLGPLHRPPLTPPAAVFAMRNAFGSWIRARVVEVSAKGTTPQSSQFSMIRVKFESKNSKTPFKVLPARCVAYSEPAIVRMTIGTRCIALFKDTTNVRRESYYSGVVAEVPNPVNNYRYLVFFDDGYAQYVHHQDTRLVVESSSLVWEEVHPFSREFVRKYLLAYPERPMVRLHTGQNIRTEWNGKWWTTKVLKVDASLVQVYFEEDKRTEWIYRGSTRLAPLFLELKAAERTRNRPMPRNRQARQHINMPYVEYTRSEEQEASRDAERQKQLQQERLEQEIRLARAVAKKSTAPAAPPAANVSNLDSVTSRVVYYTPKNAVKPLKMVPHTCSPRCKRTDVLSLSDLRTYNPLAKPLLSGWERQLVRLKGHKEVMYRAPCGRRLRDISDLHCYLRITRSELSVDLFDFSPSTHCLAEFVLNKCIVGKKDLSHGKENVPVPCVNYYDDSLPEFCSYNTERTPTAGVPLNLDPDFLCGCDCTDDCEDKSKCACWQMTLEGARTIGMDPQNVGYEYKRLLEPLPSGIYECNVRCKCKQTCLNRVAQHPLQLKLQVFKTLNRGWGIRALNDVPKGAFLCVYAGNLLTDATANLDGLNEGDEYLAELDYIEVAEQMKEGFEEDIPDADKKLDKKDSDRESSSTSPEPSSSEDEESSKGEKEDNDFQPGYIPQPKENTIFSKRLRKRDKLKGNEEKKQGEKKKEAEQKKDDKGKDSEDCITISDDEELREPSRFMAESEMANNFVSKYRSVRSLFGKDEACYIMDAKVQGNIGRYLNHSCSPNVFVQNVFVDTHDPRFPWVAFFAQSHIKAGTELTWHYNYDIGSVPEKTLYCYCGAANCRGRLL